MAGRQLLCGLFCRTGFFALSLIKSISAYAYR